MTQRVFKQADLRYLALALAADQTHAGISIFELGLGINTEGSGSKAERAKTILRTIFERPDCDELVVKLLNYVYVEDPYAVTSDANTAFATLKSNVLEPREVKLTEDGFKLPSLASSLAAEVSATEHSSGQPEGFGAPHRGAKVHTIVDPPVDLQEDVDRRKVFVVHGRDTRPVVVLRQFLHHLGLSMMQWSEAVDKAAGSQPHTYEIVRAGMAACAAVIVLFSPDDLARSKDEFCEENDPDRNLQGQARQNVLLEAGMAFAMARERTIFVKSASTREISDIAGFNWVQLDGKWDSRRDLKQRLIKAGADVRIGEYDLADELAGPFKV